MKTQRKLVPVAAAAAVMLAIPAAAQDDDMGDHGTSFQSISGLDTDGDRQVDRFEMSNYLNDTFDSFDANGDGTVAQNEANEFITRKDDSLGAQSAAKSLLASCSGEEGTCTKRDFFNRGMQAFNDADRDADGLLTSDELADWARPKSKS